MLFHFTYKDIYRVLEDIKQIFKDGYKNGKTEKEICFELGSPTELVRMLKYSSCNNKLKLIIISFYTLMGMFLCSLIFHAYNTTNLALGCVLAIVVPIFLWNLCGAGCLYKLQQRKMVIGWKWKIIVTC